jgi:hypothetical protein
MKIIIVFLLIIAGIMMACSSGTNLTKEEKSKLDPSLQRLLQDSDVPDSQYNVIVKEDGSKIYGVIIRSNNPQELENAGIFINSIQGDIITAKLTLTEIRKVAALQSVSAVENSSKSYSK